MNISQPDNALVEGLALLMPDTIVFTDRHGAASPCWCWVETLVPVRKTELLHLCNLAECRLNSADMRLYCRYLEFAGGPGVHDYAFVVAANWQVKASALLRVNAVRRHAIKDCGEDAVQVLKEIIHALPLRRDWLNPDLERTARKIIGL